MSPLTEPTRLIFKKDSVPATDVNIREVSLLLHGDGANGSTTIIDSSPSPKTVTVIGNAQISTAQSRFGGSSIAFDGSGDRLSLAAASSAWDFSGGPHTVELWLRLNALPANSCRFICAGPNNSSTSFIFSIEANGSIVARRPILGDTFIGTAAGLLSINVWHHVAFTLNGASSWVFVDGIGTSGTLTMPGSANNYLKIGHDETTPIGFGVDAQLNGYIDELRITKGIARYTANFTPPTAPFPDF